MHPFVSDSNIDFNYFSNIEAISTHLDSREQTDIRRAHDKEKTLIASYASKVRIIFVTRAEFYANSFKCLCLHATNVTRITRSWP
jgi:hypothetical protein